MTNAQGIYNVYFGDFGSIKGKGITDLVRAVDGELDASISEQLKASKQATEARETPFDYEISGGNTRQVMLGWMQSSKHWKARHLL